MFGSVPSIEPVTVVRCYLVSLETIYFVFANSVLTNVLVNSNTLQKAMQ